MRRWNGWGDEKTDYPLPPSARQYLEAAIGPGEIIEDVTLAQAIEQIPPTRLAEHPSITCEPLQRLFHARGQSLPDWVALRYGRIGAYPDGIAYPTNDEDIRSLFSYAHQTGTRLIPYGGGTSVVGHINPLSGENPVLTIDLSQINQLIDLDKTSLLATFGAGVSGPELERQLNQHGYTLGHFPQSFELSTLGGWIATRSSGQQSYFYGRIEDLFAGGHVESPLGPLDLPPFPASAAGPDLRQLILGSEGRLGVISRAAVRIRRLPPQEAFYGVFFHSWEEGMSAIRQIAQERIPISMARLSNARETETTLQLSGKETLVTWADRALRLARYSDERCLLILGVTGDAALSRFAHRQALSIIQKHGGLSTGKMIGEMWRKSRFYSPYLRNTLWEKGYAIDTLETALPWEGVLPAAEAVLQAIQDSLAEFDERVLVFAHLSHVYRDGASLYVTYLFRRTADPDETLERWRAMKSAASQAIITHHGTISHQHGVGIDHAGYLAEEKGTVGIEILSDLLRHADPDGLFNPGKLIR